MDGPEDKGPRYRLVMFVAIAAIVGPGLFLLNWMGDNGVNGLFRSLLGLDSPRARVTRTATPAATIVAASTPGQGPTFTATPTVLVVGTFPPTPTPTATPSPTTAPEPATPVSRTPAPVPTEKPAPAVTPSPKPLPTATPKPAYIGKGVAVPAYGGAAVIRLKPTTEAEALGSVPADEEVLVIRLVEGEAIDPVESRWWEIDYAGVRGFVYYKLIKLRD